MSDDKILKEETFLTKENIYLKISANKAIKF
jgi:hypothetical protein